LYDSKGNRYAETQSIKEIGRWVKKKLKKIF
jgi:hypothetical protein